MGALIERSERFSPEPVAFGDPAGTVGHMRMAAVGAFTSTRIDQAGSQPRLSSALPAYAGMQMATQGSNVRHAFTWNVRKTLGGSLST